MTISNNNIEQSVRFLYEHPSEVDKNYQILFQNLPGGSVIGISNNSEHYTIYPVDMFVEVVNFLISNNFIKKEVPTQVNKPNSDKKTTLAETVSALGHTPIQIIGKDNQTLTTTSIKKKVANNSQPIVEDFVQMDNITETPVNLSSPIQSFSNESIDAVSLTDNREVPSEQVEQQVDDIKIDKTNVDDSDKVIERKVRTGVDEIVPPNPEKIIKRT